MTLPFEISPSRLSLIFALAGALSLAGCGSAGGGQPSERSAYAVNIVKGGAAELDHRTFDSSLPGYWLVGRSATIQLSRIKDEPLTKTFSLMLRTRPDASPQKPSEIAVLRINTPDYRIVTKFNPAAVAPVDILSYSENKEATEFVLVKTDTTGKYLALERVGERVKVTFTPEAMAILGDDFVLSWEDVAPGEKTESAKAAAENSAARRIF